MKLDEMRCKPPGSVPLPVEKAVELARGIPKWTLEDKAVRREFTFRNFAEAMEFVNKVSAVAEDQNHHPDMFISYNRVRLTLSTHKLGGLSLNDFIMAAKIDRIAEPPVS